MTITVPRAEIHAIARRHSVDYDLVFDPTIKWVRATAGQLRAVGLDDPDSLAEANALDALADRIENQRDQHCIAYSHDPDTSRCACGHAEDDHDGTLGQCEAPLTTEIAA